MEKLRKLFGNTNITWKFLIVFSIIIGIGVGIINRIPVLENTSFQDIAIVLDMWIVLAIFIIVNCKTCKEAVAKCFIFFLISQPLIYLTEILINTFVYGANFKANFIEYFRNYYIGSGLLNGWLKWTFLTIPGAFVAYQIKKNNILAALVLSVATCYLAFSGTYGIINMFSNGTFPYHLLNSLLCLIMAYLLIFVILTNKKERIISVIITTIGIIISIVFININLKTPIMTNYQYVFEEDVKMVECEVDNHDIADVLLSEDGKYMDVYSSSKVGTATIKTIDENGEEHYYIVNSTSKEFEVNKK